MRIEEYYGMGSNVKPEINGKCTVHLYSDSHACQIVKVSPSGKTIWIRRNIVTCDNPEGAGHQNWNIHENEFEKVIPNFGKHSKEPVLIDVPDNYSFYKVTKRKDGKWRTTVKTCMFPLVSGTNITIGASKIKQVLPCSN